jgi:ketosteroid isomerase-like protein
MPALHRLPSDWTNKERTRCRLSIEAMGRAAIQSWLASYATAWERADSDLVVTLFSEDATYRSHIFKEPHRGREGVRTYWERATSSQESVTVRWGTPVVDGRMVAVEWWTTMRDSEAAMDITLPGVLLLEFASDDRCVSLREYWAFGEGNLEPPPGWGRIDLHTSETARDHALGWAHGYESAWRALDPEAVAPLYAENVVYRSHPLRKPHAGRDGVLAYTRQAYAAEASPDPRFGAPLAAGRTAAIEYWATLEEEGKLSTLAGCDFLLFDNEGLVTEQREYWHLEEGAKLPPEEWGWLNRG